MGSDDSQRIAKLEAAGEAHEEHDRERFARLEKLLDELRSDMKSVLGQISRHGVFTSAATVLLTAVAVALVNRFVGGQ